MNVTMKWVSGSSSSSAVRVLCGVADQRTVCQVLKGLMFFNVLVSETFVVALSAKQRTSDEAWPHGGILIGRPARTAMKSSDIQQEQQEPQQEHCKNNENKPTQWTIFRICSRL